MSSVQAAAQNGIWADVVADVVVEPKAEDYDRIAAKVTITALNGTPQDINLTEAYELPARKAVVVSARTDAGEALKATRTRNEICVYFDDKPRVLKSGMPFTWIVEYERTAEVYLHRILGYDLFIDPQRMFQGLTVISHHFNVHVTLLTPDDEHWLRLKRWRLHQRNSLNINPKVTFYDTKTVYSFTFDTVDEPFDLRIAAVYGFMSKLVAALHFLIATAVVTLVKYGPALVIELWRWINGRH